MSKVEYKAKKFLKKLILHTTLHKGTIDELEVYKPDDVIWAYKEGYRQAEKDLALAWEDIRDMGYKYNDFDTLEDLYNFIEDFRKHVSL